MNNCPARFRYESCGARSYLVLLGGAAIGVVEKKVGPGRGYSGSKQIRSEQKTVWEASVSHIEGSSLSQQEQWAIQREIKGRKTTRRFAALDLFTAYARAGVELPGFIE